jgi:hypothetical protein
LERERLSERRVAVRNPHVPQLEPNVLQKERDAAVRVALQGCHTRTGTEAQERNPDGEREKESARAQNKGDAVKKKIGEYARKLPLCSWGVESTKTRTNALKTNAKKSARLP